MPRADREEVIDAFFDLADTVTTVRSLTRQGFLLPGPNGRGQLVAHPPRGMGTGRAPGDLVAERLPGEDLRGDLLPLSGAAARPDDGADGLEDGTLAFAAARGSVEGT
jgi:hypothetical protein